MPVTKRQWTTSHRSSIEDGGIVQKIVTQAHEPGRLYVQNTQPTEQMILERNKRLQDTPGAIKDLSFGRWLGSIPSRVFLEWQKKYPELRAGAPSKQRQKRIMELLSRPENRAYLVQDPTRKSATKYHQPGLAAKEKEETPKLIIPGQ
jgi:hypothetical protein